MFIAPSRIQNSRLFVPACTLLISGSAGAADLSRYAASEIPQAGGSSVHVIRLTETGLIGGTRIVETDAGPAMLPFVGEPGDPLDAPNQLNLTQAWGQAMNDAGAIAGYGQYLREDGSTSGTLFRAVPGEGMTDIGIFDRPGGGVYDINERGESVGYALIVQGPMNLGRAFYHSPSAGMIDLGTFGGYQSYAFDVNNIGLVVGWANLSMNVYRAFAWRDGVLTNLGTLGGNHSIAYFSNDADQVFGRSGTSDGGERWFVWTQSDGMREFRPRTGTLVQELVQANGRGDLVGIYTDEAGQQVLFAYTPDRGFIDVRMLGSLNLGDVCDVNRRGEVVSMVRSESWAGFPTLFAPGEPPQRLDQVDFGLGWSVTNVVSITESGQMLVDGQDAAGNTRHAVLTPPSPCTGDIDEDRAIDLSDLAMLLSAFGCEGASCTGDLNADGAADLTDLATLLAVFGTDCD